MAKKPGTKRGAKRGTTGVATGGVAAVRQMMALTGPHPMAPSAMPMTPGAGRGGGRGRTKKRG